MSGVIRITPENMREKATQYKTQADNIQDVITKMDSLLGQLKSEWEGTASEAYEARFNELKPGFQASQELIVEISNALNSTAAHMEEVDANIASQFRG